MYTPSPGPGDDYEEFKKAFRAIKVASRRLQSIIDSEDIIPSSSSAVTTANTRPFQAAPVTTRSGPMADVVLDESAQGHSAWLDRPVSKPILLSPFRDQRKTKRKRRSRRQGMVFKDQGQTPSTGGKIKYTRAVNAQYLQQVSVCVSSPGTCLATKTHMYILQCDLSLLFLTASERLTCHVILRDSLESNMKCNY